MKIKEILRISMLSLGLAQLSDAGAADRIVTTINNDNPPAGTLSLNQAIAQLQDGDTIKFNIPGDGPHLIVTPIEGYPLITANNVTIDGYSQPGSAPNSNPILGGNNAKIKIVLDSSDDASAPSRDASNALLLERRSTRLPFSGYGDTENGIIGVLRADNFSIRGISFLGRIMKASTGEEGDEDAGDTSVSDPAIYAIALVQEATNAKVQGCWFGLAPDGTTVKPVTDAVAAFRHRDPTDTYSAGLVFGTDGDGVNDVAEFNIAIGARIALALELPNARVSGNYFNVFPNGASFYDLEAALTQWEGAGFSGPTFESFENGRSTDNTIIGTDGNGISDANERNIFAHPLYDHDIEFYSNAQNAVIAGNYFGVGVDGTTAQPALTSAAPDLISLPDIASIRVGSNGDGVSDDLEGNVIYNVPGARFVEGKNTGLIVARRNKMVGNAFEGFPFADGQDGRTYDTYYAPVLADATAGTVPVITAITNGILAGTVPAPNKTDYPAQVIDVYVVDPTADQNGKVLPGTYVTSFVEGSAKDTDPAPNAFKFNLIGSTVAPGAKVAIAVTYSQNATNTTGTNALTGPLSNAVEADIPPFAPGSIESVGLKRLAADALVTPVQADALGNWEPYASVLGNTAFLVEGNTFADGSTDKQRYVVAVQPVAGGAGKTVEGFYADDGSPFKAQLNGSRQNGNPGRVAGDKRPGAVNYVVGGEASPHAIPAFGSDNRWKTGFEYTGDSLADDPNVSRYGTIQTFALDPATLNVTPLMKAVNSDNGRLTTGVPQDSNKIEQTRFGGDLAVLDNGNIVSVVEDRTALWNTTGNGRGVVATIFSPTGQVVKDSFMVAPGEIWSNLAAYKSGFAVRVAGVIYFYDNSGTLLGQVDQNTSGESFDRGRGDGTRIAGHINSPYLFLIGKVSNENVVRVVAWDTRDRSFVAKADVSEGAFTGGFDRANLAVDALNRIVVGWVSQPAGYEAQQVAARVMALNESTKSITGLTKSFLPFQNAAETGGIRTLQMSMATTTKEILVAAKGEINLQNQPSSGANSPREVNFYTVFTHPDPKDDPTPPLSAGGGASLSIKAEGPTSMRLSWTGGTGPFLVQHKSAITETEWMNVLTTSDSTAMVPNDGTIGFFRVMNNATTTVTPLSVFMDAASEKPAANTSTATGRGIVSLEGDKLSFDVKYSGLSGAATLAHIHGPAATTVPAGVLIDLAPFNGGAFGTSGRIAGSATLNATQKAAVLAGDTYFNIHTPSNGGGEIRGQLSLADLKATINGANERPTPVDTTATGTGKFSLVGKDLFVDVSYSGLKGNITLAHIHGRAAADAAAGVLVDMKPLHTGTFGGASGQFLGRVTLTPDQLAALIDGETYFNIHSTVAGGGEIRGQIVP